MFRVQPKSEIARLAIWGVSLLYSGHSNWSGFDQDVDDVVPLAHKPWGQPGLRKRWDLGWLRSGSLWGKRGPDFDGKVSRESK